ncbi:MAG: efflux RND transporter permease subunit [Bacteroidota bacterium]
MRLPAFALKNYQFVLILVFMAILLGVYSYLSMPRSEDPDLSLPIYTVVAVYPGTSPEDMEELIADPVEEAIDQLDDITVIRTKIEEGLFIMRVEAEFSVDIDDKYDEISAEVNGLRGELPEGLYDLRVRKFSPLDVLIMQLALISKGADYHELVETAEDLQDELQTVKGVRKVKINAYPEEEIRVSLDMERMAQLHVPLVQVQGILQGNNVNIPGGDLEAGNKSYNIKTSGSYRNLDEVRNTIVSTGNGNIIRLRDVATVEMDYQDPNWVARHNGDTCVFLAITQQKGNNILTITDDLQKKVDAFQTKLGPGMALDYAFVQGPAVESRINSFFSNLLQGIALVGVVIFIFLGFRPSLVIMTIIPISILMAVGTLDMAEFGLQQISIAGLVIALGLLVDNGIVVLENIIRYRNEGMKLQEAALQGTREVGVAIISSTATTLLAFFPLTQLGGGTGEFLKTLPLIVIFALLASLLLALTVTPLLSGRFLRASGKKRKTWVLRQIEKLIERGYRPTLLFALRRPWLILLIAIGGLVGSFALFPAVGVSFFPTADKPLLLIDISSPKGASLASTDAAVQYVEAVLTESDYVSSYTSNSGHGNPQIYYNRIPRDYRKSEGQVMVRFKEWDPVAFYTELGRLRRAFADYAGAEITFSELKNGPPFEAPIEIKVIGQDLDTLRRLAGEVAEIIGTAEGTFNVENPLDRAKTDLKVEINRDKAGLLGLQLADIDLTVRTAMTGLVVDQISLEDGNEYDLNLRLPLSGEPGMRDFDRIQVASRSGAQVPLRQVADIRFAQAVNKIDHYNLQRTATITADVYNSDATAAITEGIIQDLEAFDFPVGYRYYVAGEYETQQSSFGDLGLSLILALVGIFAVLVLQFRSLLQPLIVFSAIPFAFMGSIIFLYLTGWSFSFFAFVGFTSLVGIVVNNSIILVDFTNQLMREGMAKREAIAQAAQTRFTPILLTSLTTILGLLPLTLGNTSLWSPLGWTIIGGMVVSTFLVLLIVPILYSWFTRGVGQAPAVAS